MASIVIGCVVAGVAILLGRESGALLVGESANPALDNMFAQHTRSSSEASHELAAQLCTDACS